MHSVAIGAKYRTAAMLSLLILEANAEAKLFL
jgi:hypothetical protein